MPSGQQELTNWLSSNKNKEQIKVLNAGLQFLFGLFGMYVATADSEINANCLCSHFADQPPEMGVDGKALHRS